MAGARALLRSDNESSSILGATKLIPKRYNRGGTVLRLPIYRGYGNDFPAECCHPTFSSTGLCRVGRERREGRKKNRREKKKSSERSNEERERERLE